VFGKRFSMSASLLMQLLLKFSHNEWKITVFNENGKKAKLQNRFELLKINRFLPFLELSIIF